MNQALSTQIPQIGDSPQQLLARMAAAAADQNQKIPTITWLSSNVRHTNQSLILEVPNGVCGVVLRLLPTVVPGVDTVRLVISDIPSYVALATTTASSALQPQLIILRPVKSLNSSGAVYAFSDSVGIPESIIFYVLHSGSGSFTYSVEYYWIKNS